MDIYVELWIPFGATVFDWGFWHLQFRIFTTYKLKCKYRILNAVVFGRNIFTTHIRFILTVFCDNIPFQNCLRPFIFFFTNLNPLLPQMLSSRFGKIWLNSLKEEVKNVKTLQTDGPTDGRWTTGDQNEKLTWTFGLRKLKYRLN